MAEHQRLPTLQIVPSPSSSQQRLLAFSFGLFPLSSAQRREQRRQVIEERDILKKEKKKMASSSSVAFALVAVVALFVALLVPAVQAQAPAPSPTPTSDGTSIDQGIAYVLMLVALVLTYLIHAADASPTCKLF